VARLAWFTPFPPERSGIAAYSAELLPVLAAEHEIEVFVGTPCRRPHAAGAVTVRSAHDFPWQHRGRPYDLIVYQLGNARCHDYMWAYFPRYPGLIVLHDGQVHQARASHLLQQKRESDYLAELGFTHPDAPPGLGDLVVTGLGGSLFYFWPMLGVPARTARALGVHGEWLAREVERWFPGVGVEPLRMGVPETRGDGDSVRQRWGIGPEETVLAAFGRVTPEKRIDAILDAFGHLLAYHGAARLLLVGDTAGYYDAAAAAGAAGVADRVTITGYVPDEALGDYIAAADVCLCLRWPSSGETSASWLRALSAGKPTVITERAQMAAVPALDPRGWTLLHGVEASAGAPPARAGGAAVAIDILDEQHSLKLALRRLAADAALRRDLGREARAFWERHHTLAQMADDYRGAITRALARPDPDRSRLPRHLLADGTSQACRLLEEMGARVDFLARAARGGAAASD
jgi:glycosyltransferase involved in cell wall biosynthesis